MDNELIDAVVNTVPGSPEWELELCRREFNEAGRRLREAETELSNRIKELRECAVRYGRADEAVRHGGYGPESA